MVNLNLIFLQKLFTFKPSFFNQLNRRSSFVQSIPVGTDSATVDQFPRINLNFGTIPIILCLTFLYFLSTWASIDSFPGVGKFRVGRGLKNTKRYHFPQERLKNILFWFSPAGDHAYANVKFYFEKQL
jgi:hypothetical protein